MEKGRGYFSNLCDQLSLSPCLLHVLVPVLAPLRVLIAPLSLRLVLQFCFRTTGWDDLVLDIHEESPCIGWVLKGEEVVRWCGGQ